MPPATYMFLKNIFYISPHFTTKEKNFQYEKPAFPLSSEYIRNLEWCVNESRTIITNPDVFSYSVLPVVLFRDNKLDNELKEIVCQLVNP